MAIDPWFCFTDRTAAVKGCYSIQAAVSIRSRHHCETSPRMQAYDFVRSYNVVPAPQIVDGIKIDLDRATQ